MYHFTILERMILESINKSDKTLGQLQDDTGLEASICMNVVYSLLAKNLVLTKNNVYRINTNLCESIIAELRNQKNRAVEVNTLVRECVKASIVEGQDTFKFKKVYMTEKEKKLFKAMLYNLESFLAGLDNKGGKTKEETFIFWGGDNYANAISSYIS